MLSYPAMGTKPFNSLLYSSWHIATFVTTFFLRTATVEVEILT